VESIKLLVLYILLLGDEDHRDFLNPVGICEAVILPEMGSVMKIVENVLNGCCMKDVVPLSLMDEQTGMKRPYLFS